MLTGGTQPVQGAELSLQVNLSVLAPQQAERGDLLAVIIFVGRLKSGSSTCGHLGCVNQPYPTLQAEQEVEAGGNQLTDVFVLIVIHPDDEYMPYVGRKPWGVQERLH
ncbi:hypothetical protein cyc_05001 [Cyclospora cayetanensis]|uniref:Uncharacterized protein n=1 Tax=Cyclospora cayetanensis TaxID=88456 RepID=A0A1D3D166_9EIME|nr:hypothetical protein cyc_05001 [Cyclospora cayetanensis]